MKYGVSTGGKTLSQVILETVMTGPLSEIPERVEVQVKDYVAQKMSIVIMRHKDDRVTELMNELFLRLFGEDRGK